MSDDKSSGCLGVPMVVLALVFFWPLGLVLMWSGKTFTGGLRILITLFFVGATVAGVTAGMWLPAPGCEYR